MALEQVKIHEIVKKAVGGNLDIPEFQREFVWDPEQVKLLAESLYRDYPIGAFLLWDSSDYHEAKTAQGGQASSWIVDGQQRTTALCLLLGQKPYWWQEALKWNDAVERHDVMVNVLPEEGDDRLEFGLPNPIRRHDPRWVSMRRIVSLPDVGKLTALAKEIAQSVAGHSDEGNQFARIHAQLHQLWQIRERDIPVITVSHEVEDVAEIFARLNQAGTRVREADVVLALAAVRNPGWVRTEYLPFRDELANEGWDLDAGVYIRTMAGIGRGRARLKEVPKDLWRPNNLKPAWDSAKQAIGAVVKRLGEFGISSVDLLPSTNSLIPLFVLHYRWGPAADYKFERAFHWFLLSNRDGRYSGSAITSLNEDVRAVTEASSFDEASQGLRKRLRVPSHIAADEFLTRYDRAGSRFLQLMLYLVLYRRGARDWVDRTRIGYDKSGVAVAAGFQPQWHHIYPRSVLKKANVSAGDIDLLANITVVNELTNTRRLSGKEPWHYIQEYGISHQDLESHLVPEPFASAHTKDCWSVDRYSDFVMARAQLLAAAANQFLDELETA